MKILPPPSEPQVVYAHPDGFTIKYSSLSRSLECRDEADDFTLDIPIGTEGLAALGHALIRLSTTAAQDDSEHDGAALGSELVQELLKLRGRPQALSFQAVRSKVCALTKLEHADRASGGFAVALVNVLEIGIANLPKAEVE